MSRRTLATGVVAFLLLALGIVVALVPVPYVTMRPGPTLNVLGKTGSSDIIDVSGHRTYPTSGALRLTTVSVTSPGRQVHLGEVLGAWFAKSEAVYPRDVVYPPEQSSQDAEQESSVEMVGSQDTAIAAALTELGYTVPPTVEVQALTKGLPAEGKLKVRDRILSANGTKITKVQQLTTAIQKSGVGGTVTFVIRRNGADRTVKITTVADPEDKTRALVGISPGTGYHFPFDVTVRLGEDIGGPSAGLVFSLGVYDRLTPGSLTDGRVVAGTGTITESGRVGPIGGIQQKIVAAHDAGAKLFLVPPADCAAAQGADVEKGDIELVKAPTMHSAVTSLKAYAKDRSADLPSC